MNLVIPKDIVIPPVMMKPRKKVRVKYPLFVKKSNSNLFHRANREHFRQKKNPIAEKFGNLLNMNKNKQSMLEIVEKHPESKRCKDKRIMTK